MSLSGLTSLALVAAWSIVGSPTNPGETSRSAESQSVSAQPLAADTTEERPRLQFDNDHTLDVPLDTNDTAPAPLDPLGIAPDSLLVDTTLVDTTSVAITTRALRNRVWKTSSLFARSIPFLDAHTPPPDVELDTLSFGTDAESYRATAPNERSYRLSSDTYRRQRYAANQRENWRDLAQEQQRRAAQDRQALGLNISVPGGEASAFSTIFGSPEVDLRIVGNADIDAGFNYRSSDERAATTGNAGQLDPDFKQDLRLGITGTVGDKLQIDVDWDTDNPFEYQNEVSIVYTGYEDEIVQRVEAGNVSLRTPSSLIRGGQSLFGIKSEFQVGNLNLTAVASQQDGQSNSLSIEGGAERTEFDLKTTDYDEDKHFFLSYYFRNRWEDALDDPRTITKFDNFDRISDIEVWRLETSPDPDAQNVRRGVAMVDLGEPTAVLDLADEFTDPVLPSPDNDQYDASILDALRDGDTSTPSSILTDQLTNTLNEQDFQTGSFRRLEEGRDYQLNEDLGYISLSQSLRSNEALAVSYRYRRQGAPTVQVGDLSGDSGGAGAGLDADRLALKMLRPANPTQPGAQSNPAAWYLQMRNIYPLQGRGFTADNFEVDIEYEPSGQSATNTIPAIAGQTPLMQVLGLDRRNSSGALQPNNEFDFVPGITIDPSEGLLLFPYVEPFGQRIVDAAIENGNPAAEAEEIAFREMYRQKRETARNENTGRDRFRIRGELQGTVQEFFDLDAFAGLVEGSVEVRSGGTRLQEGVDYVVDYQGGTVNITNPTYLTAGRDVEINYEQNTLAQIQQKTLLGTRADYRVRDRLSLGATVMRLSERAPIDKFRVGEEPIQNTIWGLDGSFEIEPDWLTRGVDALPFIQTRADSRISLSGEFAQLRPGHARTDAFDRARDDLQSAGLDFAPDELGGVSFIDDFEGFRNTFSLRQQPDEWIISSPPLFPESSDSPSAVDDSLRSNWRGMLGWYQLNANNRDRVAGRSTVRGNPEATELVETQDVFPERDTRGEVDPTVRTLDLHFSPWERGPYNYNRALDEFIRSPRDVWGGMMRRLPEGFTDFSLQNVEFVEFIIKPYAENNQEEAGRDATLYLNLGSISEDIIPNRRLNTEDGLSCDFESNVRFDEWTRRPTGQQDGTVNVTSDCTQDLGLDGLVSSHQGNYPIEWTEEYQFQDFLEAIENVNRAGLSNDQRLRLDAEIARAQADPSGDNYHFYGNNIFFEDPDFFPRELYPEGATLQQRFSRYFSGLELNTFEAQSRLAENVSEARGRSRSPDTEDLSFTGSVNLNNNYYEYEIPLSRSELDEQARPENTNNFVVGEVGDGWYKIRVPVRDYTRHVGDIDDFNRIEAMRLWTRGHEVPMTLRMAEFELVGSQWRASERVAAEDTLVEGPAELRVSSINNEENPTYIPPLGAIIGRDRTSRGAQQLAREQSMVVSVSDLTPNTQRGVFQSYSQGLDLLRYSNIRMYAHIHGSSSSRIERDLIEDNARLFVRFGSNETDDYYEYEQPLTASRIPDGTNSRTELWPQENEMNVPVSALNQLKVTRDAAGASMDSVFTNVDEEGTVLVPTPDSPDGTRLNIKGNPSLNAVNNVVIGVRHKGEDNRPLNEVTLWVDELRVSGYDEEGGWAALGEADIDLADFGRVSARFNRQTDGFGSLSSTLTEREQGDSENWSVRTDMNMDRFLPARHGWRMPLTLEMRSNTSTPRFDPNRGDVQIGEIEAQIDEDPSLTDSQRSQARDSLRTSVQTFNLNRSLTFSLDKSGSESRLLRYTIDALSFNISYSDSEGRSPRQRLDNSWQWSSAFDYNTSFGRERTIRPLPFLEDIPILGRLGRLEWNYIPESASFNTSARRSFSEQRARPTDLRPAETRLPDRIDNPFRENHRFTHTRGISLQYNPFSFLTTSFSTNTEQNLDDIGRETERTVLVTDSTQTTIERTIAGKTEEQALEDGDITEEEQNAGLVFSEERLRPRSEGNVLRELLDGASPRTSQYTQTFNSTLRPALLEGDAFDWVRLEDIAYRADFTWRNADEGTNLGATAQNNVQLRSGLTLDPGRVWNRFDFVDRMRAADQAAREGRDTRTPDEEDANGDNENDSENDDEEDDGPSFSDLPLPNPVTIGRRLALAVIDMDPLSFSYTANRQTTLNNIGTLPEGADSPERPYTLLDALRGEGPGLGYRFGFSRSISNDRRLINDELSTVTSNRLTDSDQIDARTGMRLIPSLQVNLNWNVQWTEEETTDLFPELDDDGFPTDNLAPRLTESGTNTVSAWVFGSYENLVSEQLDRLRDAQDAAPGTVFDAENVPLTNASVARDTRRAYLNSLGTLGSNGFLPFPLPNWNISYSGISDWPLIRSVARSATLEHSYTGTFSSGFRSLDSAGDTTSVSVGSPISYTRADFEFRQTNLERSFRPLIGIDMSWTNDVSTGISFNRTTSIFLSTSNLNIEESRTNEIQLNVNYRTQGFELPLISVGRLENDLTLRLQGSLEVRNDQRFSLSSAINDAAADPDYSISDALRSDNVSVQTETTRVRITPEIRYDLGNRVRASFILEYEMLDGDSRTSSFTSVNGGFTFNVDLSQN